MSSSFADRQSSTEIANPYLPGQPVADPEMFFGRREVLAAIRENLVKGRRVFLVAGARRMGKTSLLMQLQLNMPDGFVPVRLDLLEENARRLDWLLWRIADAVAHQLSRQLAVELDEPSWADFDGKPGLLLDSVWPEVSAALGGRTLVLLLDGVDTLAGNDAQLLEQFAGFLSDWREQDAGLALVLTAAAAREESLIRDYPRLLAGAPASVLGPLSSEESVRLITWPVEGVVTYDYGIPRRVTELTSGHPHYLQLVCHEIVERCGEAGWVNQRDVDLVLEGLVSREIADFRRDWDESSPREQAVLAALVSLRGARGVATVQEVHTTLARAGARASRQQVSDVLTSLASREILERLGALSYRFRVALLRDWLNERLVLERVVQETRWAPSRRKRNAVAREAMPREHTRLQAGTRTSTASSEDKDQDQADDQGGFRWGRIVVAIALVLALGTAILLGLSRPWEATPTPTAASGPVAAASTGHAVRASLTPWPTGSGQPRPASAATVATAPGAGPLARQDETPAPTPTPSATASPTTSPSPTAPIVVARSVPSIAFLTRPRESDTWALAVMSSSGTDQTILTEAEATFLSPPTWAPDSSSIAFVSDRAGNADIWRLDLDSGEVLNLTQHTAKHHSPAWSPDGEWIAFSSVRDSAYWELYMMRPDGSEVTRLTYWEEASDLSPSWSPDGTRLAFASKRDGNWEIYTMDLEGTSVQRLTSNPADDTKPAWSPDGSRIAFESTRDGFTDIFVMPAVGGRAENISQATWATDLGPTWSPDGGRIAFYSDRDGGWNIHVMASDGSEIVTLTDGATSAQLPAWRP